MRQSTLRINSCPKVRLFQIYLLLAAETKNLSNEGDILHDISSFVIFSETATGPDSHRERLHPVDPNGNPGRHGRNEEDIMHPRGTDYARRNSGKEGRASLADDIHSIRIALNGASATAKERTLKTLERLTARLALAESERDVALGRRESHHINPLVSALYF